MLIDVLIGLELIQVAILWTHDRIPLARGDGRHPLALAARGLHPGG